MAFSTRTLDLSCVLLCVAACGRPPSGGEAGTSDGSGESGSTTSTSSDESWDDSYCVAAGTRVDTPVGERAIEDLAIGDLVYALDPHSGQRVATPINFIRSKTRRCLEFHLEGEVTLRCTDDHPVYSPEHDSYADAGHWRSGELTHMLVATPEGPQRRGVVHVEEVAEDCVVFDIGVEHELHKFLANQVLVHNKSVATYDTHDWSAEDESSFVFEDVDPGCGQECSIWEPGTCREGQKCTAVACDETSATHDTYVCREIQGDGQPGDECMPTDGNSLSGNDTCGDNALCWNVDADTGLGTCTAYCGPPDDYLCPDNSECVLSGDSILALCIPGCDPLQQNCTDGAACLPNGTNDGFACMGSGLTQDQPYGSACDWQDCLVGLICVDASLVPEPACAMATGCCTPFCDVGETAACPGMGQECLPYWGAEDPVPGYEHVGICGLPSMP